MILKLCYFNQHWNIYFYSEGISYNDWLKEPELQTITEDRGEYRLRKYKHPEIPIHSFGFMANEGEYKPGHGGEWSSNSVAINNVFKTNLLEVDVDQISVAVPIDWLKKVMRDNVTWKEDHIYGYKITDVRNQENISNKWIEIPVSNLQVS